MVEFTGYCTYQNVDVKALIQFTLNAADDTFEATYLSFNDVPQSNLMLYGLIEKVFSEAEDDKAPPAADPAADPAAEAGQKAAGTAQQTADPITYLPVTVDELYDTLHANALNANNTYKGKYVELSGYVSTIDGGGEYLTVDNGDTWTLDSVTCYIRTDEQRNQAATFSKGQRLSVCGQITKIGDVFGYYMDIDHFGPAPSGSAGGSQTLPNWCYGTYYDEYGTSTLQFTSALAPTFTVLIYRLASLDCLGTVQGSQLTFTSDMGVDGILTHYDNGTIELRVTKSTFVYISAGDTYYFYDTVPGQYQYTGGPLDDFVIRGYTYAEAVAQGWGDEFASIAQRMGTDGESVTSRFYSFLDNCSTEYFSRYEIEGFDKDMAIMARNAPYAHEGRKFTNDTIRTFFEGFRWYYPYIEPENFQDTMLNDYEKANKDLIAYSVCKKHRDRRSPTR